MSTWLVFLVGWGCRKEEPAPIVDTTPVEEGTDLPARDGACGDDAPVIGEAGAFGRWSTEVGWTWSEAGRLSWAEPVRVRLAEDVVSVAVSVDGGPASTGFLWMVMDGRVVVDVSDRSDFARSRARSPRRPTGLATDTWDTWWDTFPHTGDSLWDSAWDSAWDTVLPEVERTGWGTSPFFHWPTPVGTIALPVSPETAPRPGCLVFAPAALAQMGEARSRVEIVVRRSEPVERPKVDVNVVVVRGAGISGPGLNAVIQEMLAALSQVVETGNVALFDVDLPGGAVIPAGGEVVDALRSSETADEPDTAINLFIVKDFLGGAGTLGFASGIPGPYGVRGTVASGVVVAVDGHRKYSGELDPRAMGLTMEHELGHQIGLFHTTEAEGVTFDPLSDTPECDVATYDRDGDGTVTAAECRNVDGRNLMFWASGGPRLDQSGISEQQGFVLTRMAVAHP